jgi:hypothetical protein
MTRGLDEKVAQALGMVECNNWMYFHADQMIKWDCAHDACYPKGSLPHYSTDMKVAYEEIVQVLRRGYNGHAAAVIRMTVYDFLGPDCQVEIYGPDIAHVCVLAQEMPEAICLAFLKVVEAINAKS